MCDLPQNVPCDMETITPPPPVQPECPESGISRMPNVFSCTEFYLCLAGFQIPRSCADGLEFSRSQNRCVPAEESDCDVPARPAECPPSNDPNNVIFISHPYDCQKYFICYNGFPEEFDCGPGLHWNPERNWCIREEDSSCDLLPKIQNITCPESSLTDLIFLPHPENCQFYFICFDMQSYLQRCFNTLRFDYILGDCFFRQNATCFAGN